MNSSDATMSSIILQIALPVPIRHHFDYLPPENFTIDTLPAIGVRIKVPFGKKNLIGFLIGITKTSDVPLQKLKPALAILDKQPIVKPELFELMQWASRYYHYPLGEVIKNSFPKKIRECDNLEMDIRVRVLSEPAAVREFAYQPPGAAQNHIIREDSNIGLMHKLTTAVGFGKNSIEMTEIEPFPSVNKTPALPLQKDQAKALHEILSCQQFQTFLLDGVTGSGKTEVYLQAISAQLKAGKQALVLVPEIALTPQTIQRFENRFSLNIIVFHSKVTASKKWDAWLTAASGKACVLIGTRSAIFAPLKNLGIIIVDEEHDPSFKQQSGFRYSAKDLAIVRGRIENIPVILGSATPSLESFYNVQLEKFKHLVLTERANQKPQPNCYLIDIKNQKLNASLSKPLLKVIEKHLKENNQVLIFLNRRGFSPLLLCHHCGWIAECKYCDAKMVWHHLPQRLFCHHCNFSHPKPQQCPACTHTEILMLGTGTEKIEQALSEQFKNTSIIRVDKDSTRLKGSMENLFEKIKTDEGQILIGTQMLAKGHHFPNLTLVAILDADSGLYNADFKASERMAQLIIQVAGRAGRGEKPGEVYIQTHHPEHPFFKTLLHQNYYTFAQQLITERKTACLPPFYHVAVARAEAKTQDQALNFLNQIQLKLNKSFKSQAVTISSAIPALMEKKANTYRAILMLSSYKRTALHHGLDKFTEIAQKYSDSKINWSLEVDPIEVL